MPDAADHAARQRAASAWLARERAHLHGEWLAAGGTEEEFLVIWDDVRAQLVAQRLDALGGRVRQRPLGMSRLQRPMIPPAATAPPKTDELTGGTRLPEA